VNTDSNADSAGGPQPRAPAPSWVAGALDAFSDALFVLDRDWRFLYVNRQAARDALRPAHELLGRSLWEEYPQLLGTPVEAHYRRAVAERAAVHFETGGLLSGRWLEVHAYPFSDGLIVISRDATQRKRAEEALHDREARLRLLVEQIPAILWTTDAELRLTSSVGAGLARLGRRPGQTVGAPLADVVAAGAAGVDVGRAVEVHRRALAGESASYDMAEWMGRAYEVHVEPLRDEGGRIVGCIGCCLDVTERKQAEAQLHEYARGLLEVQERERRHVACELHDEIGQSLTGLRLTLELASRSPPGRVRESLDEARRLIQDLTAKVRDLSLSLRPSMLDDLGLLPALRWYVERYTAQTKVRVAFEHRGLGRRLPAAAETAAYRIVQEALSNVARHAGVDHCTLAVRLEGRVLHLRIEDGGRGFDVGSVRREPSTGLSGMRERAALLGGQARFESAPGRGTRLAFELPV
jgi:PAS domain S-box-containing protein